jgi:ABC-2 type transport system permease protein
MRRPGVYAAVARTAFADRIAWRSDAFFGAFMGIARIAFALVLWGAIFDGRAEVGGMSLPAMTTYYLVAVVILQLDQSGPSSELLAAEIRAGRFGSYLARPVDPLAWFLAASLGRSAFQAAIAAIAAVLVGAALRFLGPGASSLLAPLDPAGLLAAVPVLASGLLSLALINYMTSMLAFRFQDVSAFQIAKNCVVEFLSGALIPLVLMPGWAVAALGLTPFPALAFLPAELVLGRGLASLPRAALVLAGWNVLLYAAARATFASLSARYEEFGS